MNCVQHCGIPQTGGITTVLCNHEVMGEEPDPDDPGFSYDEFAMFSDNCAEYDLDWPQGVAVERIGLESTGDTPAVSTLRWGTDEPAVVFLHGGAQNAHTWDTVILALSQPPALAVDLPGHGRSGWRTDGAYHPHNNAEAVIQTLESLLSEPVVLVGMSLGGLTANAVAARRPDLVSRLVVIDITPGVTQQKAKEIHDFVAGPQTFATFDEIFSRTVEFNPTRSEMSLRRGILHNAHRSGDGSWEWNYDRNPLSGDAFPTSELLWKDVSASSMPYLLLKAEDSPVVDDEDLAEVSRVRPDAEIVRIKDSGHSIQGDQPLLLAELLAAELDSA